jgi:hypothetical protein
LDPTPFRTTKNPVKCVKSQKNDDSTQLDRFFLTRKRFAHTPYCAEKKLK